MGVKFLYVLIIILIFSFNFCSVSVINYLLLYQEEIIAGKELYQ